MVPRLRAWAEVRLHVSPRLISPYCERCYTRKGTKVYRQGDNTYMALLAATGLSPLTFRPGLPDIPHRALSSSLKESIESTVRAALASAATLAFAAGTLGSAPEW